MISSVKELLRDTSYGRSNAVARFDPTEIIVTLKSQRVKTYNYLLSLAKASDTARLDLNERPGRITIAQMVKSATGTDNTAVPADFHKLACGLTAAGKYIPAKALEIAELLSLQGESVIYVRDGKFKGAATTAIYYALPSTAIADSGTDITDFPDGFYNAVITATAMELMHSESRETDRFAMLEELFKRQLSTLQ